MNASYALTAAMACEREAERYMREAIVLREAGDMAGRDEMLRQAMHHSDVAAHYRALYERAPIEAQAEMVH